MCSCGCSFELLFMVCERKWQNALKPSLFTSVSEIFDFKRLSGYLDAHFLPSQKHISQEGEMRAVQAHFSTGSSSGHQLTVLRTGLYLKKTKKNRGGMIWQKYHITRHFYDAWYWYIGLLKNIYKKQIRIFDIEKEKNVKWLHVIRWFLII